jgi:hypothetical protein
MQRLEDRVTIERRTRKYWKETLAALLKSWPELSSMDIRKITANACQSWATRFAKIASSNRYNNSLSLLRHVIDVAKESGIVYANAARVRKGSQFAVNNLNCQPALNSRRSSPRCKAFTAATRKIAQISRKVWPSPAAENPKLVRSNGVISIFTP